MIRRPYTGNGPAADYLATIDHLTDRETEHDAIEAEAFTVADDTICAAIQAAEEHGGTDGAIAADDVRELRRRLYQLHSAWRCRRAGIVASDPAALASAITIREMADDGA